MDVGRRKCLRHRFSRREDAELKEMVGRLGTSSWEQISLGLHGPSPRQCRERWRHFLSGRGAVDWTPDEDKIIVDTLMADGPKWARIASLLSDRTDTEVKARWKVLFKQIRHNYCRSVDGRRMAARRKPADQDGSDECQKTAAAGAETVDILDQMMFLDPASFGEQREDRDGFDFAWFFSG
jgi:hypothetical protein